MKSTCLSGRTLNSHDYKDCLVIDIIEVYYYMFRIENKCIALIFHLQGFQKNSVTLCHPEEYFFRYLWVSRLWIFPSNLSSFLISSLFDYLSFCLCFSFLNHLFFNFLPLSVLVHVWFFYQLFIFNLFFVLLILFSSFCLKKSSKYLKNQQKYTLFPSSLITFFKVYFPVRFSGFENFKSDWFGSTFLDSLWVLECKAFSEFWFRDRKTPFFVKGLLVPTPGNWCFSVKWGCRLDRAIKAYEPTTRFHSVKIRVGNAILFNSTSEKRGSLFGIIFILLRKRLK